MSERNRGQPVLHFSDGSTIDTFQSFTCRDVYTDPIGHLDFDSNPPAGKLQLYRKLLQKGEFVTLLVNGASQGGFLIQTVHKYISDTGGFAFHVECSNPLVTCYQGSIDPDIVNVHSQTDVPVEEAILKALSPYGFDRIVADTSAHVNSLTGIKVKGRGLDTDARKLKHQDAQAQDGETAYTFCSRIFIHLGVALRLSADGLLMIGKPDYQQDPVANITLGSGPGDRPYGKVDIQDTNNEQYSEVIVRGNRVVAPKTSQTARPKAQITADQAFGNLPCKYKSTPAAHKPKVVRDKHARDATRCASMAKLILGQRASSAYQIKCTMDGFVAQTGAVWSVDTVVHVKIDADEVDSDMWILERTFELNEHDGAKTHLTLIPKGSLLLGELPQ